MTDKDTGKDFRHLVRILNTDLDGSKKILVALKKIKGVDIMIANAACSIAGVDKEKKAGTLSEKEAEALNKTLRSLKQSEAPEWLFNRRKDPDTGEAVHLLGPDVKFTIENDVKMMKKTKSYKGLRHQWGLTVRGQRTKANFRRNKGRGSLGVKRKK